MNVEEVGDGFPVIVLHGGPGLDHTMFRPYLDPLGDDFRLLYVDERGQGRSDRVDATLAALGEDGAAIAASWEQEKTVESEEQLKQLLRDQMPFHFHGEVPPAYGEETVGSPDVLRHFANAGYGDFDYRPKLGGVDKPTLVVVGEHDRTTTPRAARVLHEGIGGSELVLVPSAGHMSFVDAPGFYLEAVRRFLSGIAVQA